MNCNQKILYFAKQILVPWCILNWKENHFWSCFSLLFELKLHNLWELYVLGWLSMWPHSFKLPYLTIAQQPFCSHVTFVLPWNKLDTSIKSIIHLAEPTFWSNATSHTSLLWHIISDFWHDGAACRCLVWRRLIKSRQACDFWPLSPPPKHVNIHLAQQTRPSQKHGAGLCCWLQRCTLARSVKSI